MSLTLRSSYEASRIEENSQAHIRCCGDGSAVLGPGENGIDSPPKNNVGKGWVGLRDRVDDGTDEIGLRRRDDDLREGTVEDGGEEFKLLLLRDAFLEDRSVGGEDGDHADNGADDTGGDDDEDEGEEKAEWRFGKDGLLDSFSLRGFGRRKANRVDVGAVVVVVVEVEVEVEAMLDADDEVRDRSMKVEEEALLLLVDAGGGQVLDEVTSGIFMYAPPDIFFSFLPVYPISRYPSATVRRQRQRNGPSMLRLRDGSFLRTRQARISR